ncbi:MAG TPA: DMT family transporter [Chitinophagales bacterium]|nr:DMT family transporter [Chitinophagales bacterium]
MPLLSDKHLAYIGMILVTSIVGLSFIFVKVGLEYANPIDLLAHRFSVGAITVGVLWIFGLLKFTPFSWAKTKTLLLLSLFFPLLFFAFQAYGMEYSSASEAGIIFSAVPIVTLIVAGIFLKEKTNTLQKNGIALTILGIAYIMYRTGNISENTSFKGVVLLFLSVLSVVTYYALGKKMSTKIPVLEITVWMTLLSFIVFNSWSLIIHLQNNSLNTFLEPLAHKEFIWTVVYLGVLSSVLTSFLTNYALSKIPASQIAVFNNLSPIIAIIGGVVILKETLHSYQIIGGILVIAGIVLAQISKSDKEKLN